jgi:hypothetical protein
MYLNPRNLSVREEVSNRGRQSYLRKELQLSGRTSTEDSGRLSVPGSQFSEEICCVYLTTET